MAVISSKRVADAPFTICDNNMSNITLIMMLEPFHQLISLNLCCVIIIVFSSKYSINTPRNLIELHYMLHASEK